MDYRPVLIGMNNPLSVKPEHALFPLPAGCTGNRIYEMIRSRIPELTMLDYVNAFDRRNLIRGVRWKPEESRVVARKMVPHLRDREVVVLGAGPREAFGLPALLILPQRRDGVTWRQLPHPSGRNLWYNDESHRAMAAVLLTELYVKSTSGG